MTDEEKKALMERMIRAGDYHRLVEVRAHSEVRKHEDGQEEKEMIIEGVPIVYDAPTEILRYKDPFDGKMVILNETITRGAVNEETDSDNCFMKFNHSEDMFPVARVRNKSLVLEGKDDGVHMRAKVIDTPTGQELFKLVEEGILDRMSFAFTVDKDQDCVIETKEDEETFVINRTINHIRALYDVAAVMVPAYEQTSLHARSKADCGDIRKQVEADKRAAAEAARIEEIRKSTRDLLGSADIKS